MINAKINGIPVQVAEGTTILDAARKVEVKIPTLCANDDLEPWAACGICVVKNGKSPKLIRACCTPLDEGMDIVTNDAELVSTRKTVIELILSTHPDTCLTCPRNQECELQRLAAEFGVREQPFPKRLLKIPVDDSTGSLILNPEKCIRCGRCVKVCQDMQNVWAIEFLGRGEKTRIAPAADVKLGDSPCIKCGQCSAHCPVGAIYENDQTAEVWEALLKTGDDAKTCVVQIAPAVRVALGEAFGLPPGTNLTKKIYTALRRLGFDAIFDTNFAADLTIMEEGTEFVRRFAGASGAGGEGPLPLITTCCPAWVDYLEKYYGEMIPNFSTAKSPQQMMGAMVKTYYAQKAAIDPAKLYSVSIMPCTAKKYENGRDKTMYASGQKDVDVTLTTRELARMIKQAGIDLLNLPDSEPDSPLGPSTGAGVIFGATGGVMEAALRTAYNLITGEDIKDVNFTGVRGLVRHKRGEHPHQGYRGPRRRRPPDGQHRPGARDGQEGEGRGQGSALALHRGDGLPRRLHRRRRAALRLHRRGPQDAYPRDLRRRRGIGVPLLASESIHQAGVRGIPREARQPQGARALAYAL